MKVTFDPAARDELDDIFHWIAKDNPRAAHDLIARIEAKVMRLELAALTHMGRPGLVEGTRELLEWLPVRIEITSSPYPYRGLGCSTTGLRQRLLTNGAVRIQPNKGRNNPWQNL